MRKFGALLRFRGTVSGPQFFLAGFILFAVKHNLDRLVAHEYGFPWDIFNYVVPVTHVRIGELAGPMLHFYVVLLAIAVPFIWVGVALTVARLRGAGLPLWPTILFFLPLINLLLFAVLSVLPAHTAADVREKAPADTRQQALNSALAAILMTAIVGSGVVLLSTRWMDAYGWGLFAGVPFVIGLLAAVIFNFSRPRSAVASMGVALLAVAVAGAALLAVAVEGVVCLAMAVPPGACLALLGALFGWSLMRHGSGMRSAPQTMGAVVLLLPMLIAGEHAVNIAPPVRSVVSQVVIDAPPEVVWNDLVAFTPIAEPRELLFRTGVAYPLRAEIRGQGVGATRYCVFSTGAFVEPITTWDEPHLLRFGVAAQPDAMRELSPYRDIRPAHLSNGSFRAREGQFLLTPLPGGQTLLEGTTWYQIDYAPQFYWTRWSDWIIHRIHMRVLEHIKLEAERRI